MTADLNDRSWWNEYRDELNRDKEWGSAARFFPARIEFTHGDGSWTIDTRDGVAVSVTEGAHPLGSDLVIGGPDEEWQRVLNG
ncbi:MAG TPA: hypothetical protein VMZ33_00760, partial [Candidatus Limnocylindrales bacterium]|nr:hypothetical protein [Candidatus Limnocylindrales bacterium]